MLCCLIDIILVVAKIQYLLVKPFIILPVFCEMMGLFYVMLFSDSFLSNFSFYISEYETFIKPNIGFTHQADFYSDGRKISHNFAPSSKSSSGLV